MPISKERLEKARARLLAEAEASGVNGYIRKKLQDIRAAALKKSRTREEPAVPMIPYDAEMERQYSQTSAARNRATAFMLMSPLNGAIKNAEYNQNIEEYNRLKDEMDRDVAALSDGISYDLIEMARQFADPKLVALNAEGIDRFVNYARQDDSDALEEQKKMDAGTALMPGASCLYTATDNYGPEYREASNMRFLASPEKYGFIQIPVSERRPGDIIQEETYGTHTPIHAVVFDSVDSEGRSRYNYSNGGDQPSAIVVRGRYPQLETDDGANAFRFVGTPQDSTRWIKEYEQLNQKRGGGSIHIKPENRGKFTALKKRTGHSASWFKAHGTPAQKKMATFALNARHWKHADGGPLDYSGISTTNNRAYNPDYISYIDTSLQQGGMNPMQRASVLANIIEESGGDPFAEGPGGFHGLLQWSDERYPRTKETDVYKEIDNQVKSILATANNASDHMSWTHGGKGSGYNSLKDAMAAYNGDNLDDVMRGYTLGYVRPAGGIDSYNNRLKVARQLYEKEGFLQPVPVTVNNNIRMENMADKVMSIMKDKSKALELIRKYSGVR